MKVFMAPRASDFAPKDENGIRRVCEAYEKYLPEFGIEFVSSKDKADLLVDHAGALRGEADVAMVHGLYWTADMPHPNWEMKSNRDVIMALRCARHITVPSSWVAHNIARDMRVKPTVVGHGIEYNSWSPGSNLGYVLWNKNRISDACDPSPVSRLAERFKNVNFVSTFAKENPGNISTIGVVSHTEMKRFIEGCSVYLATTKETFGIGILEAMAAGKPILGYAWGGILDLVKHGVNGYLAIPGNVDDLTNGLLYCLDHYDELGDNSHSMAAKYSWSEMARLVASVYQSTLENKLRQPTVSIVIPCYNYADRVGGAIDSALRQTYPTEIIVVDDGSTDNSAEVIDQWCREYSNIKLIRQPNSGVAEARNNGIAASTGDYICCLDADDAIAPEFICTMVNCLEEDRSLSIAYSKLYFISPDGTEGVSQWPGEFNPEAQLRGDNQIPTCCLFRREMWDRLGGYKARCHVRGGAGFEDADLWLRATEHGLGAKLATFEPLFIYSYGSGRVSSMNRQEIEDFNYQQIDHIHSWYPWSTGTNHLFASLASPKQYSHPVRQYDQPSVSVVIPVGSRHLRDLWQALDSLEAQTYRRWEAIAVIDGEHDWALLDRTMKAYPYVKFIHTGLEAKGAGYARNRGAEAAKAPLLLFLDADDWLDREFLSETLQVWSETQSAVYTDYVGKAIVSDPNQLAPDLRRHIKQYDPQTGNTVIEYHASEYDCNRAIRQPEDPPWIWNNITTLFPTAWHFEIGGFDESLPSWEDVLYWYTMARKGKCFVRLPKPLMIYQFYSGSRRDWAHQDSAGSKNWQVLLQYLERELEGVKSMGCRGCGGSHKSSGTVTSPSTTRGVSEVMSGDASWKTVVFQSNNVGDQSVRLLHPDGKYRDKKLAPGDRLLVHISDIVKYGGHFQIVEDIKLPESAPAPVQRTTVPAVPSVQVSPTDDEFARFVRERAAAIKANAQKAPPPKAEPDEYQQAVQEFRKATQGEAEDADSKPRVNIDEVEVKPVKRRVTRVSKRPK